MNVVVLELSLSPDLLLAEIVFVVFFFFCQ